VSQWAGQGIRLMNHENHVEMIIKELMKNFNETVANHTQLKSLLLPIGDGMTISTIKK
jgi:predicted O-methyltransferase YrrM